MSCHRSLLFSPSVVPLLFGSLLLGALLLGLSACDNVGRVFDPRTDSGGEPDNGVSAIQVVPAGGEVRDGRPLVRAAYPEGGGWPGTVPIVVEFSESVNELSIEPTTGAGTDGRIGVRVQGTTQLLPCQYNFVANGRLLILRPLTALSNNGNPVYEVVLFAEARDVDGVRFSVPGGETVLTDFQVNQDPAIADGRIVAVLPRDNYREQTRESNVWVIFDRPANASSIVASNVFLRPRGSSAIAVDLDLPLQTVGITDTRALRIDPLAPLSAATNYELVVNGDITFGQGGRLDFSGRTPFAGFDTVSPRAPTSVELGNAASGFPNKINIGNALSVMLQVVTPDDTVAGDRVVARIYGGNADTPQTYDLIFSEREVTVPNAGAQSIMVDFSGLLGTLVGPAFDDGPVSFAAQMRRGSRGSSFILNDEATEPAFDVTPPTLVRAGPPSASNGVDIFSDLQYLAYYGTASEALSAAQLVDTTSTFSADLFGSDDQGRFVMLPLRLGRLTAPHGYSLSLTDRSGNLIAASVTGNIVPRGVVTGTPSGTLTVEAYDAVTLQPIAGATVLVDEGAPVVPAAATLPVATTDASGRAVIPVTAGSHTITIVRAGYGLVTLYESQAAFVGLPLQPNTGATATLRGTAAFPPTAGATAIVGNTAVADRSVLGIRTTNAAPNQIPDTAILPNRAQVTTAFGGSFEATSTPTYTYQGCEICGPTLLRATAPTAPAAAGSAVSANVVLLEGGLGVSALGGPATVDFASATGLDFTQIMPRARVTSSLLGFTGQALLGIGSVTQSAGTVYSVDASFALPFLVVLSGFVPVSYLVTEAGDGSGRLSRVRSFLDPQSGQIVSGPGPQAIPTITPPGGPSVGSPLVEFQDVMASFLVPGGVAFYDVVATDAAGRRWTVLVPDRDTTGGTVTVQYPDLGSRNVAGLLVGDWSVQVEARVMLSATLESPDDLVLDERFRQEANMSRSAAVTFSVQ